MNDWQRRNQEEAHRRLARQEEAKMTDWPVMSDEQIEEACLSVYEGLDDKQGYIRARPRDYAKAGAKAQADHTGGLADFIIALVIFLSFTNGVQATTDAVASTMGTELEEDRKELADLRNKLDDREADLIEAQRQEKERIINKLERWGNNNYGIVHTDKVGQILRGDRGRDETEE